MTTQLQLSLFDDFANTSTERKTARSGTFVDNMRLPVHRWFRYSAGFSAEWVEQLLLDWDPIDTWIGELALSAGFHRYHFEKLRDRNTKWKNRKHRVPLKEGLLWICNCF